MKILWFTNNPSNAAGEFNSIPLGGGWISSLESTVAKASQLKLRICFFYHGRNLKVIKKDNVVYYGIPYKRHNAILRILNRHFTVLYDENSSFINQIIDDYKPDLIHVFGTENGFGKLLTERREKIIFHIQGLVGSVADVYFPPSFTQYKVFRNSDLVSIIRGITPVYNYKLYKKWAVREQTMIKHYKYFMGRTTYDRNYLELFNSNAKYFHCDEVMRAEFYNNLWHQPSEISSKNSLVVGTTISPYLYKGIGVVFRAMDLLKDFNITWKIFGVQEKDSVNIIVKNILNYRREKQNILYYGHLNSNDLIEQLKTCHFYVHPSFIDNSPNSVCEAMLLGMPVLASSVGGIKTLIKDEVTGYLFNPYDKHDLPGLLVHLMHNYESAIQTGKEARQVALKRHNPEKIYNDLNRIYNSIYKD